MKNKHLLVFIFSLLILISSGLLFNNSNSFAATIGSRLPSAETSWRRYDNSNEKILYSYMIQRTTNVDDSFNVTDAYGFTNASITFEFYGTKLRLLGYIYYNSSENMQITIDGIPEKFNCNYSNISSRLGQALQYEKNGLNLGIHYVTIKNLSNSHSYYFDALDIDANGYLADVNPDSISLNQSAINLEIGKSQQLTATTTPPATEVIWTSTDNSIATVDKNGVVTALKKGQTAIICQLKGTDLKAICNIYVDNSIATDVPDTPASTTYSNLFIELVDKNIKQYSVSSQEVSSFIKWFNNRAKDSAQSPIYEFNTSSGKDYIVHNHIVWFQVK